MFDTSQTLLTRYVASLRRSAKEAAEQLAILAEFAALDADPEFTHLEVAAVSRVSETFARSRLDLASALTTRLPRTMSALREGRIDEYKAQRVMLATDVLSDDLTAQVEEELLPHAEQWNTRQLNDRLRRAVIRADPAAATARAAAKTAARHVTHEDLEDGAGLLLIRGDAERTQLAYGRIHAIAKQIKSSGETRTLDQLRADVALDLLAGKHFEHAKVHVWLTIPAATALGVDEKPAYLAGHGWLPTHRALALAAQEDATWQRVLTEPATGHVVDVGRRKYTPPAALRDHVMASLPTCTGPGCTRPAHRCDQDHLVPFPAGPTNQENLHPACRPHHRAKTHGGWQITKTGTTLTWITKHGFHFPHRRTPVADPEPRVPF